MINIEARLSSETIETARLYYSIRSQTCAISNGVKQGGVLSPILYSVYVDNLIRILRYSKIGCMYNNEYMGIFTYADDISLLCPTLSGIQKNVTDM